MSKFNVPNVHGFVARVLAIMEVDNNNIFAELFYYPRYTNDLIKAGIEPEFSLKGFLATIEEAFEHQHDENIELRNAFIDANYFNNATMEVDAESKYEKIVFTQLLEFEPRLEQQIDLLFGMPKELLETTMDIIYKTIDDCIEKYGIKEVDPEEEKERKLQLESDIEDQIKKAIEGMDKK